MSSADFKDRLIELAKRGVAAAPRCANEESTKMFLVLPMISFLGYDHTNPHEVFPEHHCDFSEKYKNRVDFAIFRDETPIIAIESKPVGAALRDDRGQLKSYFNAAPTVKMGVLTDGLVWEFYADSDEPNMMDDSAFLAFDLRKIAEGKVDGSTVDALSALNKTNFEPDNIGAEAKRKHVYNSILRQITTIYQDPSESFSRTLLQNAGFERVSQRILDEYKSVVKLAFREFINQQILQRLDIPKVEQASVITVSTEVAVDVDPASKVDGIPSTSEAELTVFQWVRHRLAFLVKDDALFSAIDGVQYRDYQGKFVVFYKMERRGRVFEFHERRGGNGPLYRFIFPDDLGLNSREVATDNLIDIDEPLLAAFVGRVTSVNAPAA